MSHELTLQERASAASSTRRASTGASSRATPTSTSTLPPTPLAYYTPFVWDGLGLEAGDTVNDRAINIDRLQGFEESVLDMYSAVRDAYLRRREQRIRE